jgi:hypothetical protein
MIYRFYRNNKFCIRLYLYISYIVLLAFSMIFLNKIENIRNRQAVSITIFYIFTTRFIEAIILYESFLRDGRKLILTSALSFFYVFSLWRFASHSYVTGTRFSTRNLLPPSATGTTTTTTTTNADYSVYLRCLDWLNASSKRDGAEISCRQRNVYSDTSPLVLRNKSPLQVHYELTRLRMPFDSTTMFKSWP